MKKVEIKLHGILGKSMGRQVFNLAVKSVSEAIHAINILTSNKLNKCLNKYGYEKFNVVVNGRKIKHNTYLDVNDENIFSEISNSELVLKTNSLETIDIIPVIDGSDSDIFAIILGVVLIIVGAFTGVGPVLGTALVMGGLGIAAAGIINLLSKPPSFDPFQEIGGNTKKSYLFNGPENVVGEGGPVPVGYGRLMVGSQTVSASYDIYNIPVDNGVVNSPNNEDVISAWYFRDNENYNFSDKINKITYYAVSKRTGRGNLRLNLSDSASFESYTFGASRPRPTEYRDLPQEVLVNCLFNKSAKNVPDPVLDIYIDNLNGYKIAPSQDQETIKETVESNAYDISFYFYVTSSFPVGSFYWQSISGGSFESATTEQNSTTTIDSGSILFPRAIVLWPSYVSKLTITNYIPTDNSFNIQFKNNTCTAALTAVVLKKHIKTK